MMTASMYNSPALHSSALFLILKDRLCFVSILDNSTKAVFACPILVLISARDLPSNIGTKVFKSIRTWVGGVL